MPRTKAEPQLWSVAQGSAWSGIPYRPLLKMFERGEAPCLRVGEPQIHKMGKGRKQRRRACSRYLVPRVAFMNWFMTLAPEKQRTEHKPEAPLSYRIG
jgi:hypothetical protein